MAFYSAFQNNAFWHTQFQVVFAAPTPTPEIRPSGGYQLPFDKYEHQRKLAEQRAELKRVEDELAEAERKRLEAIVQREKAKKKAAKELAALQANLEDEISQLLAERLMLMQRIDDEEALLILSLAGRRRLRLVVLN